MAKKTTSKSKTASSSNLSEIIAAIKTAIKGKRVLFFYPVYVNTYALVHVLENKLGTALELKPLFFNWSDVPPTQLIDVLLDKKNAPHAIFCFSSSDKEDIFRRELEKAIDSNLLNYQISKPTDKKKNLQLKDDITYSNFSLKYLFFENKINIREIHNLGRMFYARNIQGDKPKPFMNKLLSILLARGYQTINIETDIQDESKGLLRKLLHEEFGFKFRLTPKGPEFKENNTLTVKTKGGQQSFEEIKRQDLGVRVKEHSNKLTFIVPDKVKYTSKTKLISIFKKDLELPNLSQSISDLAEIIFRYEDLNLLFEEKIYEDFALKNLCFIIEEIRRPDNVFNDEKFEILKKENSFLQSLLENYNVPPTLIKEQFRNYIKNKTDEKGIRSGELFKTVKSKAKYLQIDKRAKFIACLKDHHIPDYKGDSINFTFPLNSLKSKKYLDFCRNIYKHYKNNADSQKKLIDGFFILKLVIENPNGIATTEMISEDKIALFIKSQKKSKEEFEKEFKKEAKHMSQEAFNEYYHTLRIIAEDLNYLIVDERLLGDPKNILKVVDGFDISEFEFLFSIEFGRAFNYKTKPAS